MTLEKYLMEKHNINYVHAIMYLLKASSRYYRFKIDKRNGKKRTIYHPAKKLKEYQRIFLKLFFNSLPIHTSVFSYKKGISTKDMLEKHKNNNYILRLDFENFFPSIKNYNIRELLEKNIKLFPFLLNDIDITIILSAVCRNNCLTIGAVSSPQISNAILYEFDVELDKYCKSKEIVYTRYADDLFFSTNHPNQLKLIIVEVKKIIDNSTLNLKLNISKTINSSKKHLRIMTGLTITSDKKISIGLKKKNEIKSKLYKLSKKLDNINKSSLGGHLAYVKSVEPSFLLTLKRKYGDNLINDLMHAKR